MLLKSTIVIFLAATIFSCKTAKYEYITQPATPTTQTEMLPPTPTKDPFEIDGPNTTQVDTPIKFTSSNCEVSSEIIWVITGASKTGTGDTFETRIEKGGKYKVVATCNMEVVEKPITVTNPSSSNPTPNRQNKSQSQN